MATTTSANRKPERRRLPKKERKRLKQAAIGYARVSTAGQARDGVSLDAQRENIKAYAVAHDLRLVEVFTDEVSGRRADNRPGLQEAMQQAIDEQGVLVVHSLSRFARSTRDAIDLAEYLNEGGAHLASLTEQIDTTNGMGRFFFTVISALAQLERDIIAERTKVGLDHKRTRGERISRHIPFGYDLADDGKTLIENRDEQRAIRAIQRWRHQGLSLRKVAAKLNERGYLTKRGGPWIASSVQSILRRLDDK